jgi:hypothetical protein
VAADFTLDSGGTNDSPDNFPGAESPGTNVTLDAGAYNVSEIGPSGYSRSDSVGCSGTAVVGGSYTCTITNDDQPGTLTVIKHVINDNGGTKVAANFTLDSGGANDSPDNFSGAESPGTNVTLDAGAYAVTESGPAGYDVSYGAGCSGTIANGQTKTCTVTNNDQPPATITLTPSDAVNDVGTNHTVTATVRNVSNLPVPGVIVRFSTIGSTTTSGSCTTNSSGQCSFTYTGPQLPGADIITAYADTDNDGTRDPGEPQEQATKAWILPATTPGQVTGGGQILNAAGNDKVAFGFNAKSADNKLSGNCTLVDPHPSTDVKIKCLDVTSLVRTGTHATFFGNATINETPTTYRIDVDDLREPGAGYDTFKIQTATGFILGGTLTNGNIQIHK